MMKRLLQFALSVLFLPIQCYATATVVYVTPSGTATRSCPAGTISSPNLTPAQFSQNISPVAWGAGQGQIGPDTTILLCGTFNASAGSTLLTVRGGGTLGHPIKLVFDIGAVLSSPAWPNRGAIHVDGFDHWIIDGGVSNCGWVAMTAVPCNGTIKNTLNGTPGKPCPDGPCTKRNVNTVAISAGANDDIEIRNLAILDMYHICCGEDAGGPPGPVYVHFFGHSAPANGVNIHNNQLTWGAWGLYGTANNLNIANNDLQNTEHGLGFGWNTDANSTISGITVHDNRFHTSSPWDSPSNDFHHDGVHMFAYAANGVDFNLNNKFTSINIYNNLFDGDVGSHYNANIFFEGNIQNANIFNNVSIGFSSDGGQLANGFTNGYGINHNLFNNTVLGVGGTVQTYRVLGVWAGVNILIKNNVATDATVIGLQSKFPADCPGYTPCQKVSYTLSHNAYVAPTEFYNGFGSPTNGFYNFNRSGFNSFEADVRETGGVFTNNGLATSKYFNTETGQPLAGSPVIHAGANLTTLCTGLLIPGNPCLKDIAGTSRPNGAWTIGAFESFGRPPAVPGKK